MKLLFHVSLPEMQSASCNYLFGRCTFLCKSNKNWQLPFQHELSIGKLPFACLMELAYFTWHLHAQAWVLGNFGIYCILSSISTSFCQRSLKQRIDSHTVYDVGFLPEMEQDAKLHVKAQSLQMYSNLVAE